MDFLQPQTKLGKAFQTYGSLRVDTSIFAGDENSARSMASEINNLDPTFSVTRFAAGQTYKDQGFVDQFASDLTAAGLPD